MHYLVTGGCGFIGCHLVRQLLSAGHEVTIIDDLSNASDKNCPAQAKLIVQSITAHGALDNVIKKIDGIFHLAAIVSVTQSNEQWLKTHHVTLGGTVALLEVLVRAKHLVPVVYASSAAVYGDAVGTPFKESTSCAPISAYGADKLACEWHARVGALVHGIPSVGLRFFNVYGPGQDPASPYAGVISIFADRMHASQAVTIYGDGEQTRDYIHVADVVSAMQLSMQKLENKFVTHGVFNICTGVPVSVNRLAKMLAAMTSSYSEIHHAATRLGDIRTSLGDPALAQKTLGFEAKISLQDGLELTLKKR